jgi:hypothetical protein
MVLSCSEGNVTRSQPSQPTYADLEIRILDHQAAGYPVELAVADRQLPRGFLDPAALPLPWVHSADPAADGERLLRWLLADPAVKEAWDRANGLDGYCRVRLRIDAAAPELHTMPWELLRRPAPAWQPTTWPPRTKPPSPASWRCPAHPVARSSTNGCAFWWPLPIPTTWPDSS